MKLIFPRRKLLTIVFAIGILTVVSLVFLSLLGTDEDQALPGQGPRYSQSLFENYEKEINDSEIIFIGGYGRSGTTLIRSIIDVSDYVYCGPETKIVPKLLDTLSKYRTDRGVQKDLYNARITHRALDLSTASFIYTVLRKNTQMIGELMSSSNRANETLKIPKEYRKVHKKIRHLCVKDPNIISYMLHLHRIFPKAKFVYMVRDGRAVAYSMLKIRNLDLNFKNFKDELSSWSIFNFIAHRQCLMVGEHCHLIRYEDLIKNPEATLKDLVKFLVLDWSNDFLHHEKFINSKILTSDSEWSTSQVKHSIYNESLHNWIGQIQDYDQKIVSVLTAMLTVFGYDMNIEENLRKQHKAVKIWKI